MNRQNALNAAQSRFVKTMGPELGALFYVLWHEVRGLHLMWSEYCVLYASRDNFDFVHRMAGHFFNMVDTALYESIHLGLTRITAQEISGARAKQSNISVGQLSKLVAPEIRSEVARAVSHAVDAVEFAKPARNHWIAHLSSNFMLDPNYREITMGSRDEIEAALDALAGVLRVVLGHYENANAIFGSVVIDGAEDLIDLLKIADSTRVAENQSTIDRLRGSEIEGG
jgi:hypothetical protein